MLTGGSLEDAFFAATTAATQAGFEAVLDANPTFYGTDKSIKSVLNSVTDNVILKLTGNIDPLSAGTGNGVGYNDATQRNSQNEIEHLTEDAVGEIASIFFENILGGDGVVDEEAKFFEALFDDPFSAFEDEFFFAEESFFGPDIFGPDIFGPVNFFFDEGPKDEFLFFFDEGPDDFIPDEFDFSGVTIIGGDDDDTITGGVFNDLLIGGSGADTITGGDGDDTLKGMRGADVLNGGVGNDWLDGGTQDDKLSGWTGDDELYGRSENDILVGGEGNDSLYGASGDDILQGDDGKTDTDHSRDDDRLDDGTDNDSVRGGGGGDTMLDDASEVDENFAYWAEWVDAV